MEIPYKVSTLQLLVCELSNGQYSLLKETSRVFPLLLDCVTIRRFILIRLLRFNTFYNKYVSCNYLLCLIVTNPHRFILI